MSAPTTTTSYCFRCQHTPDSDDPPLKRCAGCRSRHYCSRSCQRNDWPDHKRECRALAAGEQVPGRIRQTMRLQGPFQGMGNHTRNDDQIYYLKAMLPQVHDISICGPFSSAQAIANQMKSDMKLRNCKGSDQTLQELLDTGMLTSMNHFNAPLPDGNILRFEIERETNAEVRAVIPQQPVYYIHTVVPMIHGVDPSRRTEGRAPCENARTQGTFVNKAAAERRLREVLEEVKCEMGSTSAEQVPAENDFEVTNWVVFPRREGQDNPRLVMIRYENFETRQG